MLATLTHWTQRLRRSSLALPLAVLVSALMIGISELSYHEAHGQLERLILRGRARLQITHTLQRITDAESGQRGYLLTDRDDYLVPYHNAGQDVQRGLVQLQALYQQLGEANSQTALAVLATELRAKLSELDAIISLHQAGRKATAQELLLTGIGRDQMDQIRQQSEQLLATENQRVSVGLANIFNILLRTRGGVAGMTLLSLLLLAMFLQQSRVVDRQRAEAQDRMLAERDRLETEVRQRTAELTELARHLETAREDERARLARDLHDELGALLTAAKLDVARMRPRLQQDLPDLLPRVAHLIETLNSGIALKRRIIEDLRPSTLSNLGLLPALEVLCTEFAERLDLPVVTAFEPVKLAPATELTVFRMVQESLNNVAKHARATSVQVSLQDRGSTATVTVQDDGNGCDMGHTGLARHGLVGMRYRVQAEGGQLSLQSAPGQGTRLSADLPQLPQLPQLPLGPDQPDLPAQPALPLPA